MLGTPKTIRLAGESHKPYLPETMQTAEWRKQNVLQVVLAGAELGIHFEAFSPLRDVRREGGHWHTLSHPCHCTAAAWGLSGPRLWICQCVGASFLQCKVIKQLEKGKQSFLPLRMVQHRKRDQSSGGMPSRRCSQLAGYCAV